MPRLQAATGLDLSGIRWLIAVCVIGAIVAVGTGWAARRALLQMPGAPPR